MSVLQSVMVDSREPQWVKGADYGAPVMTSLLDTGDLWLGCDDGMILIERKTPSDLLNTLSAGRLFGQVSAMKNITPWTYLVVTGSVAPGMGGKAFIDGRATGWDFAAVQGALLTVQELGCLVIYANNDMDFVPAVKRLANRDRGQVNIHPARQAYVLDPAEAFLSQLPGIGTEKVQALLSHCGTAAWALSYLTTLGERGIPGIGDGTKNQVRKVLGLKDNEQFGPILMEATE